MKLTALLLLLVAGAQAQTSEILGPQFQSIGYDGGYMFTDASSHPHWFGVFANPLGGVNTQFFDVDLTSAATTYYDTGRSGRGNVGGKAYSDGKFGIATNDPCNFYIYTLGGGFVRLTDAGWANDACGSTGPDKSVQTAYTAPDGVMFFGTAVRGTIFSYDPSGAGTLRDYGVIDPPSGNPTCSGCFRYVYTMAADNTYIYAGMRDADTNSWWLAIVARSDGAVTSCWKADTLASGSVAAASGSSQLWYSAPAGWYRIDNTGGACPTVTAAPPTTKPWYMPSNVYLAQGDADAHAVDLFSVDIDTNDVPVDSSTGGLTTFRYRNPAGSGAWSSATHAITMADSTIKRIKAKDAIEAYLASGSYGPDGVFNGSSTSIVGRITAQSTYAITPASTYVYLSGYASTTYRWTPGSAWTLTASNGAACSAGSPPNPCIAKIGWGKYHYYGKLAGDGLVYVASSYERQGRAGGDIGWINPVDGTTGELAFTCDAPVGLALVNSTTLAYSSSSEDGNFGCTNTVGKVFIFSTASRTTTATLTPIAGASSQGTIIETADGDILGIIKNYPTTGRYTLYKVSTSGTHASWSPVDRADGIFGGSAAYDRQLVRGSDGAIYAWNYTAILRIDPATGLVSTLLNQSNTTTTEIVGRWLYSAVSASLRRVALQFTGSALTKSTIAGPISIK